MGETGFHANLVLLKRDDSWNAFAFFGESRRGKTPLSFALATRLLFRNRDAEIKICDDRFEIEGGVAYCNSKWASPDIVGARFEFEWVVLDCKRSVSEFEPANEKLTINSAVMWLLLGRPPEGKPFQINKCLFDRFAEELKNTNCRWGSNDRKEDLKAIRHRLDRNWQYFLIYKEPTDNNTPDSRSVIDGLAWEALGAFEVIV